MPIYHKVLFGGEVSGEGYQVLTDGAMTDLTDLDGNPINQNLAFSYYATEPNSPTPSWGTPDV